MKVADIKFEPEDPEKLEEPDKGVIIIEGTPRSGTNLFWDIMQETELRRNSQPTEEQLPPGWTEKRELYWSKGSSW